VAAREVFVDLQNACLVAGLRGGGVNATNFPKPFHTDLLGLRVRFLTLSSGFNEFSPVDPYLVADIVGAALTVKLYSAAAPYGVLASALPGVWAIDPATENALVGQLALNTVEMQAAMAGMSPVQELSTILEITITMGGGEQYTIRHSPFPIRKSLNVAEGPVALPLDQYYTRDEIEAQFVRFVGNRAGASITLRSANNQYETILQCNDDGSNASHAAEA
jgi:hypothetical protein